MLVDIEEIVKGVLFLYVAIAVRSVLDIKSEKAEPGVRTDGSSLEGDPATLHQGR